MDNDAQLAVELDALRALCNEACSPDERQKLEKFLAQHEFLTPEHQVVFESLQALASRGPFSLVQLRVHLTIRGFPDTDVEKYFQPRIAGVESRLPGEVHS